MGHDKVAQRSQFKHRLSLCCILLVSLILSTEAGQFQPQFHISERVCGLYSVAGYPPNITGQTGQPVFPGHGTGFAAKV